MVWAIIFWISVITIIHSYIFYPLLLKILGRSRKENLDCYKPSDNLPFVSIIMSVYNEELIIIEKLRSIFNTNYPETRFELLVGSDGSTDKTNNILEVYSNDYESLRFFSHKERRGKPTIINQLREEAMGEILIFTDAQVLFTPETIFHLVKHFKNQDIGIVGGNIVNTRIDKSGISIQEWSFMSREIKMKHNEGKIWGTMIGAYGACYAIRNEYFTPVPEGFSVDDFFITMKVLERKKKCILELEAVTNENVPNRLQEEFRRKIRISAGNFRNLKTFKHLLWPPTQGLAFSFLSHKVLRWVGPFLLLLIFICNLLLINRHPFYMATIIIQVVLMLSPLIDLLLRILEIHIVFLRFVTHFYSMNLALLVGFAKYLKGSETNVWQPTRRTKGG